MLWILDGWLKSLFDDIKGLGWLWRGLPRNQTNSFVLTKLRVMLLMFDLALVAYMGLHGSQFGHYINEELGSIDVPSTKEYPGHFRCSQKRLACLDEFLDSNKVWVFEFLEPKREPQLHGDDSPPGKSQQLSILTDMEDFADLWGPVWTVPAGDNAVQQYNVSKGFIARVRDGAGDKIDGAVNCHWYSWASVNGGEAKIQPTPAKFEKGKETEDFSIPKGKRLYIGASLLLNGKPANTRLTSTRANMLRLWCPWEPPRLFGDLTHELLGFLLLNILALLYLEPRKRFQALPSRTTYGINSAKIPRGPTLAS